MERKGGRCSSLARCSVPNEYFARSGLDEWAKSIARATRGWIATSRSRSFRSTSPRTRAHWLRRAIDEHDPNPPFLRVEPKFAGLHSDPRHADLVRRMGFSQ